MNESYAYYPGCLASLSQKELDTSTRAIGKKLGFELVEIPGFTCCGAGDIHEARPEESAQRREPISERLERSALGGVPERSVRHLVPDQGRRLVLAAHESLIEQARHHHQLPAGKGPGVGRPVLNDMDLP